MKNSYEVYKHRLIYVFGIATDTHRGLLKIGDTTITTTEKNLPPNCKELNQAAIKRIKECTNTAGIAFKLLHTELAVDNKNNSFRDYKVHRVLKNFKVKLAGTTGHEWFRVDLQTAIKAIHAVKQGKRFIPGVRADNIREEIILRPEQETAVSKTVNHFQSANKFLWNAKMRFGKTLCALEVVRRMNFKKTIIITHRPVVKDGWFEDFDKIFADTDYICLTKDDKITGVKKNFVYFASIQDLRGSKAVNDKSTNNKNVEVFKTQWDLVIVDEAHEGTQTELGKDVIKTLVKHKKTKFLALSGTPFNLLDKYEADSVYTWDYVMEQQAKKNWNKNNFGDSNPYDELPQMNIFTYNLGEMLGKSFVDTEDFSFSFREFFKTQDGKFVHESDIISFLNLLVKPDANNYPFSRPDYRDMFRHTLWIIPGVKEGKALSALLKNHNVFGSFEIVNVAGDGDSDDEPGNALEKVRDAIDNYDYTITLSCGKLTAGVTVPEWTAVLMLAGSYYTSASSYLQTIFRVQSPCNKGGVSKQNCYVFDFAPDRTLRVVADFVKVLTRAGKTTDADRKHLGELLNFCPVIAVEGSEMKPLNAQKLLQRIKRAQAERIARNGFDDNNLYNDTLRDLTKIDLQKFEDLKKIIGASKPTKKPNDIPVNEQGFDNEQYDGDDTPKPRKPQTPEEREIARKAAVKRNAISILRGISIRMPLLIYGADIPVTEDFTIEMFLDPNIVDDASWAEFMPNGVTRDKFKDFIQYYDPENFINAGRIVRERALLADKLTPSERVQKIAELFATFKNPDKETVLTPWDVVKLHIDSAFDETFFTADKHILEINSKTGLYPLYVAYKIYRARLGNVDESKIKLAARQRWDKTVAENIFVICKTPMAKAITRRTLLGYRAGSFNAHCFDDLINLLKFKPDQFLKRVTNKNFWNKGVGKMFFDGVVGNPPYQEETGGAGRQARPLYQYFVESAKKLSPKYISVITPSRWFAGGMGLDNFRNEMMKDKHIKAIFDFANAKDCFPNVDISGGVCFLVWDKEYAGDCRFVNIASGEVNEMIRPLDEFPVVVRYNQAVLILRKIISYNEKSLSEIISPLTPFGLGTNCRGQTKKKSSEQLTLYASGNSVTYIDSKEIVKGLEYVDKYKVMFSQTSAEHAGESDKDGRFKVLTSSIKVLKPQEVCTHSYLIAGASSNVEEPQGLIMYLKTRFVRFLILQAVSSFHFTSKSFCFVPLQDFTSASDINWRVSIPEIDAQLYRKYGLNDAEIKFIEEKVKAMS